MEQWGTQGMMYLLLHGAPHSAVIPLHTTPLDASHHPNASFEL